MPKFFMKKILEPKILTKKILEVRDSWKKKKKSAAKNSQKNILQQNHHFAFFLVCTILVRLKIFWIQICCVSRLMILSIPHLSYKKIVGAKKSYIKIPDSKNCTEKIREVKKKIFFFFSVVFASSCNM